MAEVPKGMHASLRLLTSPVVTWWSSQRADALRFYAGYVRLPALLILGALALDKAIYYAAFPLANYLAGQADYLSAKIAAARGNDSAARQSIRAALIHTRYNPVFWRLAAQISDRLDSPEGSYCWQQLDRLNPGSFTTQMALADAALRHQQLDAASTALEEVDAARRGETAYLCDAGRLAEACGEKRQAQDYFTKVAAARPHDPPILFALAQWLQGSEAPADRRRAQSILIALSANPATRVEAARQLIPLDLKMGNAPDARKWSDVLFAWGHPTVADEVARLDVLRGAELATQLREMMIATQPEKLAPVLDWLAHRRAQAALDRIQELPAELQDRPRVARSRAGALVAIRSWKLLREYQSESCWPGDEHERLLYLARADFELGREPDARAAWSQAVLACHDYPDYLALLDHLARPQLASSTNAFCSWARVQVWTQMIARYPTQRWIVQALLADAAARHDSVREEECWMKLAALDPGDIEAAAHGALVSLLRQSRLESASAFVQRLQKENPADPVVATARAFDLYRQGRFADALAQMGELSPEDLAAPERAPYLGALLAVAGPVDRARASLDVASARADLLPEERALIDRSFQLLAYRERMAALLHGPPDSSPAPADLFTSSFSPGESSAIFRVGESVARRRAGDSSAAAQIIAAVDPTSLDPAELSIYLGGVIELLGDGKKASPYLELSPDLLFETSTQKFHQAVEMWWQLQARGPNDPCALAGLLAAYRGLEREEKDGAFWKSDEPRELNCIRLALLRGMDVDAVQERLRALLRHVPSTPEMQAEGAYALLRQGQAGAARDRMEILAPPELARPQPSLYYGVILAECGAKQRALPYLRIAAKSALLPEETSLIARTGLMP